MHAARSAASGFTKQVKTEPSSCCQHGALALSFSSSRTTSSAKLAIRLAISGGRQRRQGGTWRVAAEARAIPVAQPAGWVSQEPQHTLLP